MTLLLLVAAPTLASAQSIWPDREYWTRGSLFLEHHPTAHAAGGMVSNAIVRGPWIARPWRDRAWKRVAWSAALGAAWQYFLWREVPNYSVRHGAWDVGFNVVGSALLEAVLP